MATLREAVKTLLEGDATFNSAMVGGIFYVDDIMETTYEHGWEWAPKAGDGRLQAHAKLVWGASTPFQTASAFKVGAERTFLTLFVYHDSSYATLESALRSVKDNVLHDVFIQCDDYKLVHCQAVMSISQELQAEEYKNRPMLFARYEMRRV